MNASPLVGWQHERRPILQRLPAGFRFLLQSLDIRKPADRADLVTAARAAGFSSGVLVIDTLNRAAPGADENDSAAMGEIIAATKAIQAELGGLVLLVHHCGKDQTKGLGQAIHESQDKQAVLQSGIERQEQRLADLAGNLSAAYCQERRAEHVTAIKQLRDGLEQVRAAIKAEHALRESIKAAGYRDMLPGLHQMTFGEDSTEADALREISHYLAIHGGELSEAKKVTGIALSSFEMFGVSGQVGQALTVSEVIGEMLRYHGKFDPCGAAVKASRMQQLAAIVG